MSRKTIRIKEKLERLTILDKTGRVSKGYEPDLSEERMVYLYRLMVASRLLDERVVNLQRQGRVGTYGPCRGQEATSCGSAPVFGEEDWVVPAFREVGAMIHRGWPMESIIRFWGGYEEGCVPPEGVNDLPIAVPIATQTVHGMGLAWAMKLKDRSNAVLCYCGDGGTSEGDFHEALNFAGVYKLPLIMFVVNNQWAISIPRELQTASPTLAQKALAYGFDGIQVDGNDIFAVHRATSEAYEKAINGGGPTLIEGVTYRMLFHTTADDPKKYRSEEEVLKWEKLDPIARYEKYLRNQGILDDDKVEAIRGEYNDRVDRAVERYEAEREVDPVDCFAHTLEDLPPELREQRAEFERALAQEGHVRPGQ